jgi:uncharacterized membrane protein
VDHDRLVRVAVPKTVAGIQTRRRRSGLAERRHLDRIRQIISINLPLGLIVVLIGASGRFWG